MYVYMAGVGDGLCLAVGTPRGLINIDCGSQQDPRRPFCRLVRNSCLSPWPDSAAFLLSHFHVDHYNGLLWASARPEFRKHRILRVGDVYYPRIPVFAEGEEFLRSISTMNAMVFGDQTGLPQYDFLEAVDIIDSIEFHPHAVSCGDVITVADTTYQVVWPPQVVDERTRAAVNRAIEAFNEALEHDEILRTLYRRVNEEGLFRRYLPREAKVHDTNEDRQPEKEGALQRERRDPQAPQRRQLVIREVELGDLRKDRDRSGEQAVVQQQGPHLETLRRGAGLPPETKRANGLLKKAANLLSIALYQSGNLLFLGDAGAREIAQIVDYLQTRDGTVFSVLIAPHHGTYGHEALKILECMYALVSNGPKLHGKTHRLFGQISIRLLDTYSYGDLTAYIP